MSEAANLAKGYNEKGLSGILRTAENLICRAADNLFKIADLGVPSAAKGSLRREASVCLAEAEELIAAVRKVAGL